MEDVCPWCTWQCDRWSPLASGSLHTPDLLDLQTNLAVYRNRGTWLWIWETIRKLLKFNWGTVNEWRGIKLYKPEPMMTTWLKPVLELMTAEHRAMGFDLFCDWSAWKGFKRISDKSDDQFIFLKTENTAHCFLMSPACLHEWSPCPFQFGPGAKRHDQCVRSLTMLRDWKCVERQGKKVTWKVGRLSRPGKSSMSPVAMLKHAPCQGQRTCPLDNTPGLKMLNISYYTLLTMLNRK